MSKPRFKFLHDKNKHTIGFIDTFTERKYTEWYQLPRLLSGLNRRIKELVNANQFLLGEIAQLNGYNDIDTFLEENPNFKDKIIEVMEEE